MEQHFFRQKDYQIVRNLYFAQIASRVEYIEKENENGNEIGMLENPHM